MIDPGILNWLADVARDWVKPLIILTPMVVVGIFGYIIYQDNEEQKAKDLAKKATDPIIEPEKEVEVIIA